MPAVGSHRVLSLLVAAGLSLTLAGTVLAASWSPPVQLTASGNVWSGAIATLGPTSGIAVYRNGTKIQTRRTIDGGATWRASALVSLKGSRPDIAGKELAVDVVWTQHGKVHYRRSTNGGASYRAPIELGFVRVCPGGTAGCTPAPGAQVAHGPLNVVVVTWLDDRSQTEDPIIYARVSTNAGASFGAARIVTRVDTGPSAAPTVAVGKNGVIHVAYIDAEGPNDSAIFVRRSTDRGISWSQRIAISHAMGSNIWYGPECQPSMTAVGTHVYVAFCDGVDTDEAFWYRVAYSRSIDNGKSWGDGYFVGVFGDSSEMPYIELRGGVLRLTYSRYAEGDQHVLYRQSTNGTTWSNEEPVATGYPGGVAYFGGKAFVLFYDGNARVTMRNP